MKFKNGDIFVCKFDKNLKYKIMLLMGSNNQGIFADLKGIGKSDREFYKNGYLDFASFEILKDCELRGHPLTKIFK